jgi:ribosomal RNA-processing protein 12
MTHPPALRSQIGLYGSVLKALDRSQLDIQGIRQSFASILQLCLDGRPKVRKRAAEVIKDVLSSPPTPLIRHPYSDRVAEWIKSTLTDIVTNAVSRSKHSTSNLGCGGSRITPPCIFASSNPEASTLSES